jgi:hypothetical protein
LIALAASQAAGCIITSGDDSEDAFITANWQLASIADNQNVSCPPGYDTAALYNQPIDQAGNSIGSPVIDLFDCVNKRGTSAPLEPGLYLSWIEIANHDNTSVFAKSLSAPVDTTFDDKSFDAQILVDGGYFQLGWDLVDAATNAPLSCAQAGATNGVEAIATDVSTPSNSASDQFDCEEGLDSYVVTAGYLAATYTISVAALGANEASIGTAPEITNKRILDKNQVTNLGTVIIPID